MAFIAEKLLLAKSISEWQVLNGWHFHSLGLFSPGILRQKGIQFPYNSRQVLSS
jgi:hypothetical protein